MNSLVGQRDWRRRLTGSFCCVQALFSRARAHSFPLPGEAGRYLPAAGMAWSTVPWDRQGLTTSSASFETSRRDRAAAFHTNSVISAVTLDQRAVRERYVRASSRITGAERRQFHRTRLVSINRKAVAPQVPSTVRTWAQLSVEPERRSHRRIKNRERPALKARHVGPARRGIDELQFVCEHPGRATGHCRRRD